MRLSLHLGSIALALGLVVTMRGQSQPVDAPFLTTQVVSPTIAGLVARVKAKDSGAVADFWERARQSGTPLIEPMSGDRRYSLVTFLWRGSDETKNAVIVDGVAVAVGGVDPVNSELTRLPTTDVWYRTYAVRNDARFVYKLSENDSLQSFIDPNRKSPKVVADPLNPRLFPTGQSYVELADAPAQTLTLQSPARVGVIREESLHSDLLRNDRRLWVYTPNGFEATGSTYPLLVVFDGVGYTKWVPVARILDNLIAARRIAPMVVVMVGPAATDRDERCSARFADFLAAELVPWMRMHYRTDRGRDENGHRRLEPWWADLDLCRHASSRSVR